VHQNGKKLIDI